jgi:hypothetical protein
MSAALINSWVVFDSSSLEQEKVISIVRNTTNFKPLVKDTKKLFACY